MRCLVTGATGLIGTAVTARLIAEVTGIARNISRAGRRMPGVRWAGLDIAHATLPDAWRAHLSGVDAVVNCAGILQDAPGESVSGVHERGMAALFEARGRAPRGAAFRHRGRTRRADNVFAQQTSRR